jgi:hypothetical protein
MISLFLTAIMSLLPAAIAALPALVAMPVSALVVKLALSALPYPEGPREAIDLAANKVLNFGLTGVLVFFLGLMAASNMAAYQPQSAYDAAASQRR